MSARFHLYCSGVFARSRSCANATTEQTITTAAISVRFMRSFYPRHSICRRSCAWGLGTPRSRKHEVDIAEHVLEGTGLRNGQIGHDGKMIGRAERCVSAHDIDGRDAIAKG